MKAARQLSVALLVLLGTAALFLSYHMISDPTGNSLGFPVYLLNGTMYSDYATPGWILFFTNAVPPFFVVLLIVKKSRLYSIFIMLQGVIVCVFVFMAIILLEESFLIQYLFLALGILLIAIGALQYQRKIATESRKPVSTPEPKSHPHKHRKHK